MRRHRACDPRQLLNAWPLPGLKRTHTRGVVLSCGSFVMRKISLHRSSSL
jgi:hypothetical protein